MTNQTFNQLYQETLKKNSEEIKKFLKDFYPQRSDFFDTLNFKFIEQQASLDGSLPLYVDMITNKRTIRVNVKDVSPLYVDSLIEGLKLERPDMEHKLELFVYFVKDFDPQAISKPPQKKRDTSPFKMVF